MKALAQFVVHVFDLVEAEGRTLLQVVRAEAGRAHVSAVYLLLGLGFLAVSVPLIVLGVLLVGAGLYWWLESMLGRPGGAAMTGLLVLVAGGACMYGFWRLAKGTVDRMVDRPATPASSTAPHHASQSVQSPGVAPQPPQASAPGSIR